MSTVINAGQRGHNSGALLARLEADVLAHEPDLVVLMAGTSDALGADSLVPFDEFRSNLLAVGTRIMARSRLLLLTIPPCHLDDVFSHTDWRVYREHGPLERILRLNRIIRDATGELQAPLADIHRIFAAVGKIGEAKISLLRNRANSGARDGIHPTAHGHRVLAAAVRHTIATHRLPTTRIVCFGDGITYGTHMSGEGTSEGDTYPAELKRLLGEG